MDDSREYQLIKLLERFVVAHEKCAEALTIQAEASHKAGNLSEEMLALGRRINFGLDEDEL